MPNINEMKETKYMKKEDVGNGALLTIASVRNENLAREGDPAEHKWVMYFRETTLPNGHEVKPMVCNWTNLQLTALALGSEETDEWTGKQIVAYNDPSVSYGDRLVGGIRLRKVAGKAAQQAQEQAPPADDLSDEIPF